ncbi:MAG: PEP-CTERM sorting domain-containing protein [Tepidisphaeraceae bacterium]
MALGQAQSITTNSGSTTYSPLLALNSFTLTAYVDTSGNVISGDADALDIAGPSSTISYHSGTGQSVTPLSAFGWVFNSEGGHTYQGNFEFEYIEDSTAGALAQAGTLVYVTLYGTFTSSPNAPSFSANFSEASLNGYSDAYPAVPAVVPEPSSAALLIGAVGLLWRRRRSS